MTRSLLMMALESYDRKLGFEQMENARLEATFVSQACQTPERVAIVHQGRQTSYRQLDLRSNQIAYSLARHGKGAETLVAVCMQRSPDMIACLLGILKAGAAYVPLDPEYPQERMDYILADSGAEVLVASREQVEAAKFSGHHICPEEWSDEPFQEGEEPFSTPGDADALAYVIYTSGTTGKPKGVMLSHTASALVTWARQSFTSHQRSRVAATSSICFDPSILEIFVPLCLGGTVILKKNSLEPFSADEQPTMINVVPAVLEQLLKSKALPQSLKVINVGGERVKAGLARQIYQTLPDVSVYNHYGPTEATTCTTVALVERDPSGDPPIGEPICGARVYILDEGKRILGTGVTGEIYIGGPTLAKGYINRPELTAERFTKEINGSSEERMYRTGDLGCWMDNGNLRYIGRVDDQIKFRGVRIELGEIEASLRGIAPIENAVVAVRTDPTQKERLVAYIEAREEADTRKIREKLEQQLPRALLPSHFVMVREWPLNLSGKVDRLALPSPAWDVRPTVPALEGDALEELIINSFRYCLGVQQVNLDDNFFELGGDSLLAEEVMLELERVLGTPISATMFTQNPTPRLLAASCFLEPATPTSHLVKLQAEGSKLPLFCVPDVFGMPLSFMSIARALAPEQPVYGLAVGPLEASMIEKPSVTMLTRAFLQEVQMVQPQGPYQICGYSFGGTSAFDLAQALRAKGHEVALILLDCVVYQGSPRVKLLCSAFMRQGIHKTLSLLNRSRLEWLRFSQLMFLRDIPHWVPANKRKVALASTKAKAKYRYAPFSGETLLVESAIPDKSYAI